MIWDDVLQCLISEHYKLTATSGVMGFGSSFELDACSSERDIDLLIVEENYPRFTHRIEIIDGLTFDIFIMSPEYAFYQLHRREQMWLHNFSVGAICHPHLALTALKQTATDILASETPRYSTEDAQQSLYFLYIKYEKLCREVDNTVFFENLLTDFIRLLNQHLHLSSGLWPGLGSSKDKFARLTERFGKFSEQVKNLYDASTNIDKFTYLTAIINLLPSCPINQSHRIIVQDVDVSTQTNNFIAKRM